MLENNKLGVDLRLILSEYTPYLNSFANGWAQFGAFWFKVISGALILGEFL
jgi:hypothetical protein